MSTKRQSKGKANGVSRKKSKIVEDDPPTMSEEDDDDDDDRKSEDEERDEDELTEENESLVSVCACTRYRRNDPHQPVSATFSISCLTASRKPFSPFLPLILVSAS